MSALSPTMEQGNLIKWVKKEGDKIEPGDALCSVQTDKAVMDMEYQEEGYLAKILVEGGTDSVEIGRPIAIFVEEEEDIAKVKDFTLDGGAAPAKEVESQQEEPQQRVEQPAQQQQQQAAPAQKQSGDRLKASPYAKTLAKERGVDLNQIAQGSGPEGRIVASDVEKFTPGAQPAQPQQKAAATTAAPAAMAAPVSQDFQDVPVSQVRRVIAERLLESKRTIPHYYLTVECEMDELLRIRSLLNKRFEKEGVKLSVNDFILKAAALAAKAVPEANSSWQGTFIRQYNSVDMSVAVQTDNGLITPIVFDCDKKGLKEISKDVKALAEKARDGKLQPHEFQGGSFTVSNLGMFGIKEFSAIINPPQACILAVGSAQRKVVETPEGGYRTATTINVTLSCDHRVVDGAVGAEFLKVFSRNITDPLNMLA
eukprot:CAMPEP_0117448136 /NCGR_PEP_ID=MMETSP0759-20121206/7242_1 /TAXON_ID=63605 /ORGANISM="Percolomonas cosmopolitus, Strain WS" /LENGTH=425 /DNA_ID=CAMNT_0005240507 /DNA_START=319 /DNA_END=1596 /DNA_ORIENTATION=+